LTWFRKTHLSETDVDLCLTSEQLAKYTDNLCTDDELRTIENHLLKCDFCFDAAEGVKKYSSGKMIMKDTKAIKDALGKKNKKPFYKVYYPAAAVIAFIIFSLMLFNNKSEGEKIFDNYFEPYQSIIPIVRGDEIKLLRAQALQSYEAKDYESAADLFNKILIENPGDKKVSFYYGITLLLLDKESEAVSYLKIASDDDILSAQAHYYHSLALIKANKFKEAADLLSQMIKNQSSYSAAANKLLNELP
jgi:hypothetical protein